MLVRGSVWVRSTGAAEVVLGSESGSVSGEASDARGEASEGRRWTAHEAIVSEPRARIVCVVGDGMEGRVRGKRRKSGVGGGRILQGQFKRPAGVVVGEPVCWGYAWVLVWGFCSAPAARARLGLAVESGRAALISSLSTPSSNSRYGTLPHNKTHETATQQHTPSSSTPILELEPAAGEVSVSAEVDSQGELRSRAEGRRYTGGKTDECRQGTS